MRSNEPLFFSMTVPPVGLTIPFVISQNYIKFNFSYVLPDLSSRLLDLSQTKNTQDFVLGVFVGR